MPAKNALLIENGAAQRVGRRMLLAAAMALTACSPVYVLRSAAGHASFLWRRQSVEKLIADPRTEASLREKLKLVQEIRAFSFDEMGLRRSGAYSTVSHVEGCCVTHIVSACEKTAFKQRQWWFPFLGRVPYKGYFHKTDAESEALRWERRGLDASVAGVSAYHTGLWVSDPIPSPVLDYPPGELASLLIHELTHGTVFFKDAVDFDESLAEFVGEQGAEDFLKKRFGADSEEARGLRASLARGRAFARLMHVAYEQLDALYKSGRSEEEKLRERERVFSGLRQTGGGRINNATIMAHRIYHEDADVFKAVYEGSGRDWKKALSVFRSLDKKDPREALRAYSSSAWPAL